MTGSWKKLQLTELCASPDDIRCGPFGTQLNKDEFRQAGVPLWGIKQVNRNFSIHTHEFLEPETADRLRQYDLRAGDLVMTRKGTVGNCAVYPASFETGIMHSDLLRIRVDPKRCHSQFLVHQLHHSQDVTHQLSLISNGAIMPGINVGRLKQLEVTVPSLAEQKRIATILDKADAIRRKLQQSLRLSDDFLRSIFLDMFGDPVTNPKGWTTMPITKACKFTSGATPSKGNSEYWDGLIPWVSPKDMKRYWIDDSINHVSEVALKNAKLKSMAPGAILIVVRGMILAHSFPVAQTREKVTINQDMKALTPLHGLKSEYVAWSLRCQKHKILSLVSNAGHGTCRLDQESLSSVEIGIPDKELQNRFSLTVKKIAAFSERLTSQISEANNLFSSLQQRAFRGEL